VDEKAIEIINNVTSFITYFVPGYIFISCFNFISCKNRDSDIKYLVIKSISISYVIHFIVNTLGTNYGWSPIIIQITTFAVALILGFVSGRVIRTNFCNNFSLKLFRRELETNFFVRLWEESYKNNYVVKAIIKTTNDNIVYDGQIKRVNSYNTDPEIVLVYYTSYDNKNNIIEEQIDNDNAATIIRYSNIKSFNYELIEINNNEE